MTQNFCTFIKEKKIISNTLFILFIILLRVSVFGNYVVPTGSMNPTILEGDRFFSNKLAYGFKPPFSGEYLVSWDTPARGDIVAFDYPLDRSVQFTKRVIGIPGDKITVKDKFIYINGKKLATLDAGMNGSLKLFRETLGSTSYIVQHSQYTTQLDNVEVRVPAGHIFVMGDNRDNSSDSRVWGFVPLANVSGKIIFRWMSFDSGKPEVRFSRIGIIK